MQGKATYVRPKVVGPFPGPYASGSYVHRAALFRELFVLTLLLLNLRTALYFKSLFLKVMFVLYFNASGCFMEILNELLITR
jgi:hypothetical protein